MSQAGAGSSSSYADAGVSIDAGERAVALMRAAVGRAGRPEVVGGIGGFAGLFDASALKNYERPLLASATDGVGTKVDIARRLGVYDTIGHDLVAMVMPLAMSSARVAKSMPKKQGHFTGGDEIRMWTSAAPASRSIRTRARWVLPRTIESSTTTSRLPRITSRSGLSLSRMPNCRMVCDGWMNVRPT